MSGRVVYDTNILLGSLFTSSELSTNRQAVERWRLGHVELLYSLDTLLEYSEKLIELSPNPSVALELLVSIAEWGELVAIENFISGITRPILTISLLSSAPRMARPPTSSPTIAT